MGVQHHLIIPIASSPRAELFEYVTGKLKISPKLAARILFEKTKEWKRAGLNIVRITSEQWIEYFKHLSDFPALSEIVDTVISSIIINKSNVKDEINEYISDEIEKSALKNIITESFNDKLNRNTSKEMIHKQLMGFVMQKVRGKIPGKRVNKLIWGEMKEQEV